MVPDLDPDKPDPDPVWPDLDPAISGSGSGLPGSRSGNIRIWIRLLPDLDPVAAGSKVPHELSGPVQALAVRLYSRWWDSGCLDAVYSPCITNIQEVQEHVYMYSV